MRVGFAGTPVFAVAALEAILGAGYDVPLVLTQPDRPKGRGLALQPSPVKTAAMARGLPVLQPASLKTAEARAPIVAIPVDVLVVAAYGLILPPAILEWPRHGAINIHASLLPRWRGAAPIHRAILAGDPQSGVTIMKMDAGLDTGPMIRSVAVSIGGRESTGSLHDKLAAAGAAAIVATLQDLARTGVVSSTPQPAEGVTYAAKIERREAAIDWSAPAQLVDRQVRAFDPGPGAYTQLRNETWKIWRGEAVEAEPAEPGTVLRTDAHGIVVACGAGAIRVTELQPAGGKRLDAAAVHAGRRVRAGDRFDVRSA